MPEPVRFLVLGDTGEGNVAQYAVAEAMERVCGDLGCDFVVLLGDNIYDAGVDGVEDPQWEEKFEAPYADLDLPFFAVLGNHDYGGRVGLLDFGGVGNEWTKGPHEVAYSEVSAKFTMPSTHYTFTWGNVGFIMLDTNSLLWNDVTHGDQRAWYPTALVETSGVDWVFAAGHHPYRSNGSHGNAGSYEAIELGGDELPLPLPILDGGFVRRFFEDVLCGTVDIYFAGHDHNRQWLDENDMLCGTEMVVSGAGAKLTTLKAGRGNAFHWQDDTKEGFLHVEVVGETLHGRFYDRDGVLDYERTLTR